MSQSVIVERKCASGPSWCIRTTEFLPEERIICHEVVKVMCTASLMLANLSSLWGAADNLQSTYRIHHLVVQKKKDCGDSTTRGSVVRVLAWLDILHSLVAALWCTRCSLEVKISHANTPLLKSRHMLYLRRSDWHKGTAAVTLCQVLAGLKRSLFHGLKKVWAHIVPHLLGPRRQMLEHVPAMKP